MEQQERQAEQVKEWQAAEQQPIKLMIFLQVLHLPLTDKRKIMLTTLMSMQKHLATEPIEYKGEYFWFHFKQQEIFQVLNIPKTTFEYNMRWLRKHGYLNYKRGCIPGTNKQTTYFNINTEFVQEQYNNKLEVQAHDNSPQ